MTQQKHAAAATLFGKHPVVPHFPPPSLILSTHRTCITLAKPQLYGGGDASFFEGGQELARHVLQLVWQGTKRQLMGQASNVAGHGLVCCDDGLV